MINPQSVLNVMHLMLNHSGWMLKMQVAWPSVWFLSNPPQFLLLHTLAHFHIFPHQRFQTFPPPWTFDGDFNDDDDDMMMMMMMFARRSTFVRLCTSQWSETHWSVVEHLSLPYLLVLIINTMVMIINTLVMIINTLIMIINTLVMIINTLVMIINTAQRWSSVDRHQYGLRHQYRWENESQDHQRIPRTGVDLASLGKLPKISSWIIQPRTIVKKKGLAVSTWPSSPIQT